MHVTHLADQKEPSNQAAVAGVKWSSGVISDECTPAS